MPAASSAAFWAILNCWNCRPPTRRCPRWHGSPSRHMTTLTTISEGADALQQAAAQLDACFLNGFVEGQAEALAALSHIFTGTPLQRRIEESCQALAWNEFVEPHFVTLAAARSALQGTLYDALRQQASAALGRAPAVDASAALRFPTRTDALLDSTRHWLMELAIAGFARAE